MSFGKTGFLPPLESSPLQDVNRGDSLKVKDIKAGDNRKVVLTKGLTEFVKQVIKEPCFGEYIFNNSKTMKPYFELKDQWTNNWQHVGIKGYSFRILRIHSQHARQQRALVFLSLCSLWRTKIQRLRGDPRTTQTSI
jgi:hypothetical protein